MGFRGMGCVVRCAVACATAVGAACLLTLTASATDEGSAKEGAVRASAKAGATKTAVASATTGVVTTAKDQSATAIVTQSVGGVDQIKIPLGAPIPKYSVTRIEKPERLVIDLETTALKHLRPSKTNTHDFVSAVRVGTHPNMTRVVVDLKVNTASTHGARLEGDTLLITVAAQRAVEQVVTQKPHARDAETTKLKSVREKVAQALPTQTTLALDEEAVVSGSSKKDVTSAAALSNQPPAKQAVTQPVENPAPIVVADRARLSFPALEQELRVAKVLEPIVSNNMSYTEWFRGADKVRASLAVQTRGAATPARVQGTSGEGAGGEGVTKRDTTVAKPATVPAASREQESKGVSKEVSVEFTSNDSVADRPAVPAKISAVLLEGSDKVSPAVVLKVAEGVEYSITRSAPSEYVLTLRDAAAAPVVLQQTLFASQESSGIRSVRAVAEGANTLVRIFTQPSSYLTARRSEGTIRVEETQDLAQIARDIRAQIAPAAAKAAEAGKDVVPATDSKASDAPAKKSPSAADKPEPGQGEQQSADRAQGELAGIKGASLTYTGRLISLDLQDADIDSALRIIAEVSNLNIIAGEGVVGKVTLKLVDVPWDQALEVILKSHGLDKVLEGNVLRVAPVDKLRAERESFKQARVAEEELEPLSVKYVRVSYAKAAEIKGLVETVLSERGTVAFDERSNQLVVKDTRKGLQNVTELIKKIDLRTPQILLETQIIEANRNLSRQLGAELGFQYIQSPATGNGTGLNFPSAIALGGSADPTNSNSITGSAFPVASTATLGSAVTMLFDSADGTKSLALRLSQLEQEGQVRIISKPAVATTNNKAAEIKSVEKYRVKLPNGGLSVASGSGATSSGSGNVATQTIEAGIILNVTPQASPDYYILLDIKAKSSSFGAKSVDGIPNEIERSASSSVLVSSGQTFALGGIYKINEQDRVSGMPFFKDIPVLGTLFRNTVTEQADEELLFFITPRIVEGSFEDATAKVVS